MGDIVFFLFLTKGYLTGQYLVHNNIEVCNVCYLLYTLTQLVTEGIQQVSSCVYMGM